MPVCSDSFDVSVLGRAYCCRVVVCGVLCGLACRCAVGDHSGDGEGEDQHQHLLGKCSTVGDVVVVAQQGVVWYWATLCSCR